MTFFYDLNKKLADLAKRQDLIESAQPAMAEGSTGDYSAKKAAAGKDIGKPGKMFSKIAKSAGKEYGSKAAGERVAGAVLNKLRKGVKEDGMEEGNEFSGELVKARAQGAKEFKVDGKSYPVKEGAKPDYIDLDQDGNRKETMKKAAADKKKSKSAGTAFDPEVARSMFATKDKHPRYDVKDTGYSKRYTRKEEPEAEKDDAEVSDQPKKKGRPKGPEKGPERVTKGSTKYKMVGGQRVKKEKTKEDLDADGVMMTRPSNMSSEDIESISLINKGEYDQEGDMAKKDLKSLAMAAKELHAILGDDQNLPEWIQSKITKALDYINSSNQYMHQEQGDMVKEGTTDDIITAAVILGKLVGRSEKGETIEPKELATQLRQVHQRLSRVMGGVPVDTLRPETKPVTEKAVSQKQQKFMGMAHAMQKGDKIKGASPELKKVAKTMNKSDVEDFAKTKHKGLPKKAKTEETAEAPKEKTSKGGYNFGGGVYESMNKRLTQALNEGMSININVDEQGKKSISVNATEEDAEALANLLKMAGMGGQGHEGSCPTCNRAPCGCAEMVDENSPDWPTNTETSDNALQYSGGLNGPKSTGQTTVPVVASQLRRQVSMEESVKLENDLFRLYQNYKAQ
jgi:hypothetical protein